LLAFVVIGKYLDFPCLYIRARDARRELLSCFASDQPPLRVENKPVGAVRLFSKDRQLAVRRQLHDSFERCFGKVDVAACVRRRTFRKGDDRGDFGFLRRSRRISREGGEQDKDSHEERHITTSLPYARR